MADAGTFRKAERENLVRAEKAEADRDALAAQVDEMTRALEEIQCNDPEANRQHADEIANRALAKSAPTALRERLLTECEAAYKYGWGDRGSHGRNIVNSADCNADWQKSETKARLEGGSR